METAPPEPITDELDSQVRAEDQKKCIPRGRYHLAVVGGGSSGIAIATEAASLGARVALVEKKLLAGDRLNCGVVPRQALIRSAQAIYDASRGSEFGFYISTMPQIDFGEVMNRMHCLQTSLSLQHSTARLKSLGIDVYQGATRFTGRNSLEIDGQPLKFHRAIICTGGHPKPTTLAGLEEVGYRTSESIFSLTELPKCLIVLGAGSLGCEFAQTFRRFGSDVHLVSRSPEILTGEEPAAARLVHEQLEREGIHLHLGWTAITAEKTGHSKSLILERRGEKKKIFTDEILLTAGSQPNVGGLSLEQAGVDFTQQGIVIDERLRTTNRAIFAFGDVTGKPQLACAANALARICLQNALFFLWRRGNSIVAPRCTFTDPEVAQIGLTEAEAQRQDILIDTYHTDLCDVDRAVLDGEAAGFVRVHCRRGTGRVIGATVVGRWASELIGEISLLMSKSLSLRSLGSVNRCDPTQGNALRRIAESYSRRQRHPYVTRAMQYYFSLWPRGAK